MSVGVLWPRHCMKMNWHRLALSPSGGSCHCPIPRSRAGPSDAQALGDGVFQWVSAPGKLTMDSM